MDARINIQDALGLGIGTHAMLAVSVRCGGMAVVRSDASGAVVPELHAAASQAMPTSSAMPVAASRATPCGRWPSASGCWAPRRWS